jgi:HAD superfamily hydrolase (TIGR01509 family)
VKAVLFDMDGVIVNSEAQWKSLEAAYFRELAPAWTKEHDERAVGLGVEDLHRFLVKEFDVDVSKNEFLAHCDVTARKVYEQNVDCAEGFLDLARELKHRGIKTAIASSSPAHWIKMVVDRFALSPLLDTIVSADDVGGRTKPNPDIYLEAAARLSIPTVECLAIEDSSVGMLAAKRAGMKVAGYRNGTNDGQDLSIADFELGGFSGLSYEKLVSRLRR